jgi:aldehyde dehydrogenase (NAD+)
VGKKVMKAAADNLASVTLELGGKSPAIVDETVNLKKTAKMLAQSKFYNKGQICIATDYVFVHQSVAKKFGDAVTEALKDLYPEDQFQKNRDYARLVDVRHMNRIVSLVDDAVDKGAKTLTQMEVNEEYRFVSPVVVSGVTSDMLIDQEEIFGPIMPIKSFSNLDEVIHAINAGEKPLAMYIFSKKKEVQARLLKETSAGAAVINEVSIHHFNSELPFGGVNNSGIGKSHGYFGFLEFSNQKAVVKQWAPFHISALLQPPYTGFTKWLVDKLVRFF